MLRLLGEERVELRDDGRISGSGLADGDGDGQGSLAGSQIRIKST
jgi:hypothetical protein